MRPFKKIYALYKGDKYIDSGTAKELAEKMHVTPRTIRYYSTPTYAKRVPKGNGMCVIALDDEEEE